MPRRRREKNSSQKYTGKRLLPPAKRRKYLDNAYSYSIKTTNKPSRRLARLSWEPTGGTFSGITLIFIETLKFRRLSSRFIAENTVKSMPLKIKNNVQLLPKQLLGNF